MDSVYGYAAIRSYLAYGDDNFLKIAQKIWDKGASFTVSDSDVRAGKSAMKNVDIVPACPNGGEFHWTRRSRLKLTTNSLLGAVSYSRWWNILRKRKSGLNQIDSLID